MPGINQFPDKLSNRDMQSVATKSGVDFRNLAAALKAKKPMSFAMARKTAGLFGAEERPVTFYVLANTRTMKARVTAGDGVGAALRGISAVLDQLRDLTPAELAAEGKDLQEAVEAMTLEVNQILAHGTSAAGEPTGTPLSKIPGTDASGFGVTKKSRRDAAGRRVPEGEPVTRDPHGRAIRET